MFVFSILRNRYSSKKDSEKRVKKNPKPTIAALFNAMRLHRKLANQVSKKQKLEVILPPSFLNMVKNKSSAFFRNLQNVASHR